jgi:hypothetical protein
MDHHDRNLEAALERLRGRNVPGLSAVVFDSWLVR